MKKIIILTSLLALSTLTAQFKILIEAPANFESKEVYIYSLNGSKDILFSHESRKSNSWNINFNKPYKGMLKAYFPEVNATVNFISENKDVSIKLITDNKKVNDISYQDDSNNLMNNIQGIQQKKEYILPALYQIKEYYKSNDSFGSALDLEIERLSKPVQDLSNHPFVQYYNENYKKFIEKNPSKEPITHETIIAFLSKSPEMLESSSLLRPILVSYLNIGPSANVSVDIEKLLKSLNTSSSRGQNVLAELIEIFDMYDMQELKTKYLNEAINLKSTNDRLSGTIAKSKSTQVGATLPNYTFNRATNTNAKTLYDVIANKKIIVFWASTCSHCEAELPKIAEKYSLLKKEKVEVIALSLDNEKDSYEKKIKEFPWINDSELKGWHSASADIYNIQATPTFFILDANNKIIAKPEHAADVISFFKLN